MSAPDKKRYPREEALKVAKEIYEQLNPWCDRCKIVGSLRRRKAFVGDVEVLFIGKIEEQPDGLFDKKQVNLALLRLDHLLKCGLIKKRENVNGSTMWGDKNRYAVHCASGIPVDFFATTEPCWFNYLTCRTGGAVNNTRLAEAYQRQGMQWKPYGIGYADRRGREYPNKSEQDVYRNAGLGYLEPWQRP